MLYPGLASHPQHALARRQMQGGYGGIVTAVLRGGLEPRAASLERCRLFALAESLGRRRESHRASGAHDARLAARRRCAQSLGISDGLVRLSVGVEDVEDLIAELRQALG